MTDISKFQLRKIYREKCLHVSPKERIAAGLAAKNILTQQTFFNTSDHIACYLPLSNEFDVLPLIEAIWAAKKKCYVPVLAKQEDKILHFVRYQYGDALHLNRYGILEPKKTQQEILLSELELVLTPLIAFDLQGNRLGTGGGYYDRTFAFINEERVKKPILWGVGYACQEVDHIPADPWDVKLTSIITELKYIAINY